MIVVENRARLADVQMTEFLLMKYVIFDGYIWA